MKNTGTAKAIGKDKPDVLIYSPETKHLFSKESQHFFETTSKRMPTQPKYFAAQKRLVLELTEKIYRKNPELPLRQVIRKVLKVLPDFLTGENLQTVVGYIVETWQQAQEKETTTSNLQEATTP
jgi:hypothetical protein